tara:strand:+ start:54 stop:395 length:342 start_codon:yes stop_codon:yes gene_type:complete
MLVVEKPWGNELIWAHTDKYVAKILTISPGQKLSRQYHEVKDETIYVSSGTLILEVGYEDSMIRMVCQKGFQRRIHPGEIHRFSAPASGCVLFEVSTPELDDVVRLEDEYGRV